MNWKNSRQHEFFFTWQCSRPGGSEADPCFPGKNLPRSLLERICNLRVVFPVVMLGAENITNQPLATQQLANVILTSVIRFAIVVRLVGSARPGDDGLTFQLPPHSSRCEKYESMSPDRNINGIRPTRIPIFVLGPRLVIDMNWKAVPFNL